MNCTACGIDLPETAAFCPKCGAPVGGAPPDAEPAGPGAGLRRAVGRHDDPETELWTGGYSGKAMMGSFVGALLLSIALLVGGVFYAPAFPFLVAGAVAVWLWVLAVLAYRRLNISYRLTSQRFFHQTGVLTRTTNRVEVIQMDDVTYTQSFFERFFGVGTIKITSSDPTDPLLVMTGIADVQHVAELIDQARRKELTRRGLRIESV